MKCGHFYICPFLFPLSQEVAASPFLTVPVLYLLFAVVAEKGGSSYWFRGHGGDSALVVAELEGVGGEKLDDLFVSCGRG